MKKNATNNEIMMGEAGKGSLNSKDMRTEKKINAVKIERRIEFRKIILRFWLPFS
ncbi:unnamed protein product [marine sediment metagenome]|uniref:Uncharacterized protein n=1 Tax=marine sediment metagenome TaxID=412755 RepID=X0TPS5_9ZZZZ